MNLRTRQGTNGNTEVYDPLRRRFVALTPEEFVRQHFAAWLAGSLGYPASLMANEVSLTLNNTRRRCDTLVFDTDGKPLMIVEYKAPMSASIKTSSTRLYATTWCFMPAIWLSATASAITAA